MLIRWPPGPSEKTFICDCVASGDVTFIFKMSVPLIYTEQMEVYLDWSFNHTNICLRQNYIVCSSIPLTLPRLKSHLVSPKWQLTQLEASQCGSTLKWNAIDCCFMQTPKNPSSNWLPFSESVSFSLEVLSQEYFPTSHYYKIWRLIVGFHVFHVGVDIIFQ